MINAIVLAAGEGSRMGELKQLLPWKDRTILETVILNLDSSRLDGEIRVVVGSEAERIKKVLRKNEKISPVVLENPDYQRGMFSSVMRGIKNLPQETEGLLFMLADQPLVTSDIYNKLIGEFKERNSLILAPSYQDRRGHPLLLSEQMLPEVHKLAEGGQPEGGLRSLLRQNSELIDYVEVDDKSVVIDLDYKKDYYKYHPDKTQEEEM